jgi:hypothetical protein
MPGARPQPLSNRYIKGSLAVAATFVTMTVAEGIAEGAARHEPDTNAQALSRD